MLSLKEINTLRQAHDKALKVLRLIERESVKVGVSRIAVNNANFELRRLYAHKLDIQLRALYRFYSYYIKITQI